MRVGSAVLAHAVDVLVAYLTGIYKDTPSSAVLRDTRKALTMAGFDPTFALASDTLWERIKQVRQVVAKLTEKVELHRLDALYE